MNNNQKYFAIFAAIVVVLLVIAFGMPHEREGSGLGAKLDRAADKVSEGISDAGKELKPESQKTIGEKIGDTVEDAGKSIKGTAH